MLKVYIIKKIMCNFILETINKTKNIYLPYMLKTN